MLKKLMIGIPVALFILSAQQPTCNKCNASYVSSEEIQSYLKRAEDNGLVDQQTRAFEVEALIENREAVLKPGFFVKATIPSSFVADALFVPQDALLYVYGVYKVFVLDGNTVKEKEVKIGERSGDDVEIVEGLAQGERVALASKGQTLKEGVVVEIAQ